MHNNVTSTLATLCTRKAVLLNVLMLCSAVVSAQEMENFVKFGKKIIAIGPNYMSHAAELGLTVPKVPTMFLKPSSAYITEGQLIKKPTGCNELQTEVELGLVIERTASKLSEENAMDYVAGYALALDMTCRDWQRDAMKNGQPWLLAKGFDTSCPVSRFIRKQEIADINNVTLWASVNGTMMHNASTSEMNFSFAYILHHVTQHITLEPGDLVLTGTPPGTTSVVSGDLIEAGIGNVMRMKFSVM